MVQERQKRGINQCYCYYLTTNNLIGVQVKSEQRAAIVTLQHQGYSVRNIAKIVGVPKSTCHDIIKHTLSSALLSLPTLPPQAPQISTPSLPNPLPPALPPALPEVPLQLALPLSQRLDHLYPSPRLGRPRLLSDSQKNHLKEVVKSSWKTRRMNIAELREEAGLGNVSITTIQRALHEKGFGSYREQWKFILDEENRQRRKLWCEDKKDWNIEKDWADIAFTDEMSIEIGGTYGVNLIWREKDEKWHSDCIGQKKKKCPTVMCWGMIGFGWKGPFYVWDTETEEEKQVAIREIDELNKIMIEEIER